jgi:hypothetical protein
VKTIRPWPMSLALALCLLASPPAALGASPSVDPGNVVDTLPLPASFLERIATENRPDPSGAEQGNRGGSWRTVNYQIGTDRLVTAGLRDRNPQYIAQALSAASYAFAHQNPDGSFVDAMGYNPREQAGATGGFVFYLAHSLLMLRESSWFMQSAQTAQLRPQAESLYRPFGVTLNWFIPQAGLLRTDVAATNRIMSYGAEYYLSGKLLSNQQAIDIGRSFIEEALQKQLGDGTFPEVGGFDSSYQNVSLYFGQVIFLQMPASDPLRDRLWDAIQAGVAREWRNLAPSGEISTVGNTRIHYIPGAARQHELDSHYAVLAGAYYAAITGDPRAQQNVGLILGHYFAQ